MDPYSVYQNLAFDVRDRGKEDPLHIGMPPDSSTGCDLLHRTTDECRYCFWNGCVSCGERALCVLCKRMTCLSACPNLFKGVRFSGWSSVCDKCDPSKIRVLPPLLVDWCRDVLGVMVSGTSSVTSGVGSVAGSASGSAAAGSPSGLASGSAVIGSASGSGSAAVVGSASGSAAVGSPSGSAVIGSASGSASGSTASAVPVNVGSGPTEDDDVVVIDPPVLPEGETTIYTAGRPIEAQYAKYVLEAIEYIEGGYEACRNIPENPPPGYEGARLPRPIRIMQIIAVYRPGHKHSYESRRKSRVKYDKNKSVDEVIVFHGTSMESAMDIAQYNFRANCVGAGAAYGRGTYSTKSISIAIEHGLDRNRRNEGAIVIAELLKGKHGFTSSGDTRPSDDCNTGGNGTEWIFVTFYDNELLAQYIVSFEKADKPDVIKRQIASIKNQCDKRMKATIPVAKVLPVVQSSVASPSSAQSPAPAVVQSPAPVVVPSPAPVLVQSPAPAVVPSPAPAVVQSPAPAVVPSPAPAVAQSPTQVMAPSPAPAVVRRMLASKALNNRRAPKSPAVLPPVIQSPASAVVSPAAVVQSPAPAVPPMIQSPAVPPMIQSPAVVPSPAPAVLPSASPAPPVAAGPTTPPSSPKYKDDPHSSQDSDPKDDPDDPDWGRASRRKRRGGAAKRGRK